MRGILRVITLINITAPRCLAVQLSWTLSIKATDVTVDLLHNIIFAGWHLAHALWVRLFGRARGSVRRTTVVVVGVQREGGSCPRRQASVIWWRWVTVAVISWRFNLDHVKRWLATTGRLQNRCYTGGNTQKKNYKNKNILPLISCTINVQ